MYSLFSLATNGLVQVSPFALTCNFLPVVRGTSYVSFGACFETESMCHLLLSCANRRTLCIVAFSISTSYLTGFGVITVFPFLGVQLGKKVTRVGPKAANIIRRDFPAPVDAEMSVKLQSALADCASLRTRC